MQTSPLGRMRAKGRPWGMTLAAAMSIVTASASAQQPAAPAVTPAAAPLVFDGVTVVDVERGTVLPAQRVVIVGTQIQAMGPAQKVKLPKDAQVVDARGST